MHHQIRSIFSAFVLVMLGVFAWRVYHGAWSPVNWVMLALAATVCLLVFVRFVYIFNFSYALSAGLIGALIWVARPSPAVALVAGAAILYGLRLLSFTWSRTRSRSYEARMANVTSVDREMPLAGKLILWFTCTWLLTFHLMALWLAAEAAKPTPGIIIGAVIMLLGTLIEGAADRQKQQRKRAAPDDYVSSGLFARWRHPNYLGEILMQAGLIFVAVSCANGPGDLLAGVVSPLYIILLMIAEAQRVDEYQVTRYGSDPSWVEYRHRSGSLLPKFRTSE